MGLPLTNVVSQMSLTWSKMVRAGIVNADDRVSRMIRAPSPNRLTWLGTVLWLASAIMPVYAADRAYCTLYSREMLRAYVRSLPANDLPNLTVDTLAYRLTQFTSSCLSLDNPPALNLPSDGKWIADLYSEVQRSLRHPAGSVPATEKPASPVSSPPPLTPPPAAASKTSTGQPQPLCTSHDMRTVYSGVSWRCVK